MAKKTKARQRTNLPTNGVASLDALAEKLNIPKWDVMLVGDGSGSGWSIGVGWACAVIDRASRAAELFYGAANKGTITIAELWPYIYAMTWFASDDGPGKQRLRTATSMGRNLNVHVITDNDYVAKAGMDRNLRHAHQALWASIDSFATQGYSMFWHHMPREVVNLNIFVDQLSKCARLAMDPVMDQTSIALAKEFPGLPAKLDVYDFTA